MRSIAVAAALAVLPSCRLAALQCPDGAPPPCRTTTSLGARVPALALNDRTWLILPFDNTTHAADAELIRQASVSQLYGELSRWEGVRVVSDDRVADLLQQLPAAQRERPGLESALILARRAGAGRVVLGGYVAAGGRANITVKVYETRSGQELRVVRDPLSGFLTPAALDSLGASFGRLARGILDVPEGSGGAWSGVGTSSMAAYRAYVSGVDALNGLALDSATARFERAVRFDSSFAMPRLQLRRLTNDTAAARLHLEAAIRLSASLPAGARALVEGLAARDRGDRAGLCRAANQLVGVDSADAEGWALLAFCHRDFQVVVENGRPRLSGDVNRALRAAERAYALAPNALSSVQAMNTTLGVAAFMQCVPPATGSCPPDNNYRVAFLPAGDTLAVVIGAWSAVRSDPPDLTPAAVEGQVARFRRLVSMIERLLVANPDSRIVQNALAMTAMAGGDIATAEAHFGRGRPQPIDGSRFAYLQARFELALALERPVSFQAFADSLFPRSPNALQQYRSMLGRLSENGDSSVAGRQVTAWRVLLTGVLPPGLDTLEQAMAARLSGPQRDDFLQLTTLAGFHLRHTGPALDTLARHPLKRFQAWFARGDMTRARAALSEFDRELLARHPNTADDGGWLFDAEAYLDLGDTATAFQRMQQFGRRWPTSIQGAYIMETRYFQSTTPRLWGRAWLLYGDLAMARRQSADARRAYRMVVGLWETGEAPVQPMVTRARAALAQLGG